MKTLLLLSAFLVGCGNNPGSYYEGFEASYPPTGESIKVARKIADLFPNDSEAVYQRILNTNLNYVPDRTVECPKGAFGCYKNTDIYLEPQDTYFVQCYIYSHEFLHVALGVVNNDTDHDHNAFGNGPTDYSRISDTVCNDYWTVLGNPYQDELRR
jgi:hypothetical protein